MNETVAILGKLMDATSMRQRVLANNLANANTPGYLRKDVDFSEDLSKAIKSGSVDEILGVQPESKVDEEATVNAKGNSVSLQKEMGAIAQNELLYNFAAEMTSHKFSMLSKSITGSK